MAHTEKDSKYYDKPHLVRSPTLLIGIGGIGGQIVHGVYNAMSDYDRSRVEMLVMDTNINDLDKFIGTGIQYIQTSENKTVQNYLEPNEDYAEWFPVNPLINAKNLSQGAGQIRSVSRLGALASKAEGRFAPIEAAIDRLLVNHGDTLDRVARVMVVGSATGGTGSGLGVQLPFFVRNVLAKKNVPNVLVRGLFLMPSLTVEKQDTEAKEKAVNVNGYAFLKEVNAFYHAQMSIAEDNVLSIEEYVPGVKAPTTGGAKLVSAAPVPYDFLFLVEKYSNRGSVGKLEDYIARSAQIVINQLFSPVAAHGFSAEDNLITSSVPTGGMNRYCGAGIANAIYPKEEVMRYCTVRYAGNLIKSYWLQIDDEFNTRDDQQRRMRKTNSTLQPLDKSVVYCQIFDDMCDPSKHEVSSDLAALKKELSIDVEVKDKKDPSKKRLESHSLVDTIVKNIEKHFKDVFTASGLTAEATACHMDSSVLQYPDEAADEVATKLTKLSKFRTNADEKVSNLVVSTAEEILPADFKLAKGVSKDAKYNLFVTLREKHPIITRYVLYTLRGLLNEKKQLSDRRLEERTMFESVFDKDYYKEKGGKDTQKETPQEALDRTPAGWLSFVGLTSAAYKKLVRDISKDAASEAGHILEMAEHSLKSTAYRIVLERIDTLIKLYEDFFEELRDIVERKAEETKRLEDGKGSDTDKDFKGDKYICCNAQCKKVLYTEFENKIGDKGMEMSDDVKRGFFDKMFEEYTSKHAELSNPTAYLPHLSLSQLFEEGILQPITDQFRDNGFRHLDMSILEAIEKEFEIEKKMTKTEDNKKAYTDAFEQYFSNLCASLRILASPYLSYNLEVSDYKSGGKLAYTWGLNHSVVARFQSGSVDRGVDKQMLQDMFASTEAALADESFSPYQLVCYAAIYDLRVENCTDYYKGTDPEKYYAERLNNLADQAYEINNDQDGYLEVIHPHLDCRWHEHAYLPELMGMDDEKQCKNTRLAFMLAVCAGRCEYFRDAIECLECWWYTKNGSSVPNAVFVNSREVMDASIYALYKAFDSNRVIVDDMKQYIENAQAEAKRKLPETGATAEVVAQQALIRALTGDGEHTRNVLDVLYTLYQNIGNLKEVNLCFNVLIDFIYEYCLDMTNKQPHRATAMSVAICTAIVDAYPALKNEDMSKKFIGSCTSFRDGRKI